MKQNPTLVKIAQIVQSILHTENQEFTLLSDRLQQGMGQKLL